MDQQQSVRQRSKMMVDPATQGVILRKAIFHWSVFTAVSLLLVTIIQFCSDPFAGIDSNIIKTLRTFAPVTLTLVCLGPVFVYDFLKLSNRIFGPIPRIRRNIKALAAGEDIQILQAREQDCHYGLVSDINLLFQMVKDSRDQGTEPDDSVQNSVAANVDQPQASSKRMAVSEDELARDVRALLALVRESRADAEAKEAPANASAQKTSNQN